jgi:branched-chain amino acid transport system ATP-binding protein
VNAEVLRVENVSKRFGALQAANGISLSLERGARRGLIGPNGAGKTTLVGLLSGVLRPSSGRIVLNGRDVTRTSPRHRVKSGLVRSFQISNLFTSFTVLENLYLALSEHLGIAGNMWRTAGKRREVIDRAMTILQQLRIEDDAHRRVDALPYGKQRLVELALALSLEPSVLLLDEPAAGIPSNETSVVIDALERLPSEMAILMIEHDMYVVRRFASDVTVLVEGAVLMTGTCDDVMASDEVHAVYLGDAGKHRLGASVTHA